MDPKHFSLGLVSILFSLGCLAQGVKDCNTDIITRNKNRFSTVTEKKIIIPIQWVMIRQYLAAAAKEGNILGKELGKLKMLKQKVPMQLHINTLDSLILQLTKEKAIPETEELYKLAFCYLTKNRNNIQTMNSILQKNESDVAIEKILSLMQTKREEEKNNLLQIDNVLNAMANKYDLYKFK